jgi:putative drug exporter of the RND superfamily
MAKLLTFAAGRRAKWVVAAAWIAIFAAVVGLDLPGKFSAAEKNESSSFLPGDAESTKELAQSDRLQQGEQAPIVVVYRRASGLSGADRARIGRQRAQLNGMDLPRTSPFGAPVFSQDGKAALLVADIDASGGQSDTILDPVNDTRKLVSDPGGGLEVKVTGGAGFSADAIKVFEGINGTLVGSAFLLVLVLLILIYRSPIFWIVPITAVGFAELATRGVGYGLTEAGVTVNGQSSAILSVLVLGAGTDYALLLVARYREELRRHEDKHEAMALALRTAGPAIFASALTVIAALLCLSLAEVNGTSGLGPIGAMGVAVAGISMLTLLPALLTIAGRPIFWHPKMFGGTNGIPHFGDTGADETHGFWRRVADRVARRPRRIWIGAVATLVVFALGLLNFSNGLTQGNSFRGTVESVEGQELLAASFPAGANAPTEVFVPAGTDPTRVGQALRGAPGVAQVAPGPRGEAGVLLNVILRDPPYSTQAFDLIPGLRDTAKRAGGPTTLVGGPTAIEHDLRKASARDTRVIVPLVLFVVLLILIALLRAVVVPLLLIGTVILSFAAALGVGAVVFDVVFGFPGSDASLPLFAFVFLVALGIDYNIFLMARVREETLRHGTRAGMIRGLAVTGGVITSAGIVLAGTFIVLAVLPLVFLTEIGFVIAFGVLLDTFLVRSVLVPALVLDGGPKVWWPSRLARDDAARAAASEHREVPV